MLDLRSGDLKRNGRAARLQGQPAQLLAVLVSRRGELVTRDELRAQLWPEDTFVDFDHGLNNAVNRIREVLGDSAASPRYIETVPRRGYRFMAEVEAPAESLHSKLVTEPAESQTAANEVRRFDWRLAWLPPVILAMVLVAVVAYRELRPSAPRIQSVAVLPFSNVSGDPAQDYFADGVSDQITTDLARLPSPLVISRTSTLLYRGANKPLPQIGRELGIDAVVEGSVLRSGNRVRITVQLIEARTDKHLWAQSYERDFSDILEVQDMVATEIAQQVRARVSSGPRLLSHPRLDPVAYDAYLKSVYYSEKGTDADLRKSFDLAQEAVAKDPDFASAYAHLANIYILLGNYGIWESPKAYEGAKAAVTRALQLDDTLSDAHQVLALIKHSHEWDQQGADVEYRRAIQLSPSSASAHEQYSWYLSHLKRPAEALEEARRAHELNPTSDWPITLAGIALDTSGRHGEAIAKYQSALAMAPSANTSFYLAYAYLRSGQCDQALAEAAKWRWEEIGVLQLGFLGMANGFCGRRDAARRVQAQLLEARKHSPVKAYLLAMTAAGLDEKEEALAWLEKGYDEHDDWLNWLFVDPAFDRIRPDARFQALLREIGFLQ